MKVEIFSDVACPWCYIGERRFARALAAFPQADRLEVVYRPYQLDPGAPTAPVPLLEHFERKFGDRAQELLRTVSDAARAEGIEFDWERAQSVNTLTAHRLLRLAVEEYGAPVQRALAEKLFEAHFSKGGDVSDHALLTDLAVAVGMDRARVHDYLASGEGVEETRYEIDQGRRLGVQAVPTFVFEARYGVQGAQAPSTFLQVLEQMAAESETSGAASTGADACGDEGCAV
jgi:predicted DsbA family dithiol-disulfide isomerase